MSLRPQRKLVSFIGIGSSTASPLLYSYIKAHPGVSVPSEQTDFFCSTEAFKKGISWYESKFVKKGDQVVCGELADNYIESAEAASLIARTYPSAHLIAVIENPLVSVRVAYVEARRAQKISSQTSLAMFLKQNPEVLLNARYGRQLAQYFSYYAPIDLLVLTASEVREDPLRTIRETYKHIGVDESFVPTNLLHLVPVEDDPKKKPGLIKRTYRHIKKFIKDTVSKVVNRFFPKEVPIETAAVVARQIPLSPPLESYLKDYYRTDVAMLSRLVHRSLSAEWGFDDETASKVSHN